MGFGLFGKMPQKRDFVAVNLPHSVLNPFETWLQSCVSASRAEIGREWENYYLVAPIWHFWLGPEILGTTCAGALMSSVDQVGRYFPLAILYMAEPGESLPPPLLAPLEGWYAQLDQRLLAVLSEQREFEAAAVLSGLERPVTEGAVAELVVVVPGTPAAVPSGAMPAEPPTDTAEEAEQPAGEEPSAHPAAAPPAEGAAPSPWDDPAAPDAVEDRPAAPAGDAWGDLPELDAKDFGLPASAVGSDIRDLPPSGQTIPPGDPPAAAVAAVAAALEPAPAAEPSVLAPETGTEAADAPGEAPPPLEPPAEVELAPPRIYSEIFKGGLDARIEPQRTFIEALGGLLALDYRNAVNGRGYWWCGASSTGYAAFFVRQGLPDPYYYSRMLMWAGKQQ